MRDRFAPMQADACGDERFPFSAELSFYVSALKLLSVFTVPFMADPLSGENALCGCFSECLSWFLVQSTDFSEEFELFFKIHGCHSQVPFFFFV